MDIFFEIHKNLPREGPGDSRSTTRALSMLKNLPPDPLILDIGCGPGMQTIDLAIETGGKVIAIDTHHPFLHDLQRKSQTRRVENFISPANASMFDLPFLEKSFDCIWSEGAIYIIGFEKGLQGWRRLLKPDGCMAVLEISWLKPDPPQEVISYWAAEYPGMRSVAENLKIIQAAGYQVLGQFTLPKSSWWDEYYTPIENRVPMLREKWQGKAEENEWLDATLKEIQIFREYSDWYGYVFYVLQVM